jgi:hypothetical protein
MGLADQVHCTVLLCSALQALGYHMVSGAFTFDMFKHGLELPTLVPNASVVVSARGQHCP